MNIILIVLLLVFAGYSGIATAEVVLKNKTVNNLEKRIKTLEKNNEIQKSDIEQSKNIIEEYKKDLNPKQLALRNIQMVLNGKITFIVPDLKYEIPLYSERTNYLDDMLKVIRELNEIDGG